MDSSTTHSPVFLVFPPEIIAPEYESTELSTTTFSTQSPLQKLFATKMKIIGTIQILFGIMTFSFGVIFLFTLLKPYPRFPFIFLSGYPFWGSVLIILTRIMNFLSALGAIAGITLLIFGFMLDQNYICGYSHQNSHCNADYCPVHEESLQPEIYKWNSEEHESCSCLQTHLPVMLICNPIPGPCGLKEKEVKVSRPFKI
ncbi:hypothetical protein H8959_002460 [Pygathrix nigripes]